MYDPEKNLFVVSKGGVITLEHSLVSLSKWESKWKVPFLNDKSMTHEQLIDYVKCMTITQNVDPNLYYLLTTNDVQTIVKYIEDPMTATTINESQSKLSRGGPKIITSELIYYWMTALNIPFECQKWHLNRLLTLIRVAAIEQQPPKKMNPKDAMRQQHALNQARRARYHTKG